jgi:hypothetical protein
MGFGKGGGKLWTWRQRIWCPTGWRPEPRSRLPPSSVSSVFELVPLRLLPLFRRAGQESLSTAPSARSIRGMIRESVVT